MRRDDGLYLEDIVEAADAIAGFVTGIEEAAFVGSDLLRSAVLQKLTIIGEAASRVSEGLRERHTDIPWSRIVAFRNIAVHAYFSVDWHVVWEAATQDAPQLREFVADIIDWEYPGTDRE